MISLIYNVILLVIQTGTGSQGPPQPAHEGSRGPQLPIDDNLWILIILGIILGIYMTYRRNRSINKA